MLMRQAWQGEGLKGLFHLEEIKGQFCCTEPTAGEETVRLFVRDVNFEIYTVACKN